MARKKRKQKSRKRYKVKSKSNCGLVVDVTESPQHWWSISPVKEAIAMFIVTAALCMTWLVYKSQPTITNQLVPAVVEALKK